MANVLKRERQLAALNLLVEASGIRACERITGIHRDTLCRLVVRFGDACRDFLDEKMRGLRLEHIECDEIWTFVAKKQARLTTTERAERSDIGDVYLWTAIDMETKLVPTWVLGKRSADMARRLMMDLRSRLDMPNPHASDAHKFKPMRFDPVTQISTDAFAGYPEAVDLAFGPYVRYGQLIKDYRNADQPGRYAPPEMVGSQRKTVFGEFDPWSICTSHVERHNLTIRTFMKRFSRLTLGFSKKLENLAGAVAMFLAYYNFCWRPRMPDWSGTPGKKMPTPAVAAGITDRFWKFADLFEAVMP
jgi:IS1 family transposase